MLTYFADWLPRLEDKDSFKLSVAMADGDGGQSVRFPVVGRSLAGSTLVGATLDSRPTPRALLAESEDGHGWRKPRVVETGTSLPNLSLGALSALGGGRWVLAGSGWRQTPGRIDRAGQRPSGVNRYRWSGFGIERQPFVLVSDDAARWTAATIDAGPFLAAAPCGRVVEDNGSIYLPVYGPITEAQMSAAMSDIGLLASDNGGASWSLSHYIARADLKEGIAWGPSDVVALPDGRWLAMLEGRYRTLGDFSRPRICRSESRDGGRTWTEPEHQLLGPAPTIASLGDEQVMVGTWYDAGMVYNVSRDAARRWEYQGLAWDCIWYAEFERGGFRLLTLDSDTVMGVFHWGSQKDIKVSEIKTILISRR